MKKITAKQIGFILGPIAFALIYWAIPFGTLSVQGKGVLATLVWV